MATDLPQLATEYAVKGALKNTNMGLWERGQPLVDLQTHGGVESVIQMVETR